VGGSFVTWIARLFVIATPFTYPVSQIHAYPISYFRIHDMLWKQQMSMHGFDTHLLTLVSSGCQSSKCRLNPDTNCFASYYIEVRNKPSSFSFDVFLLGCSFDPFLLHCSDFQSSGKYLECQAQSCPVENRLSGRPTGFRLQYHQSVEKKVSLMIVRDSSLPTYLIALWFWFPKERREN
jgi:hypothetical protein